MNDPIAPFFSGSAAMEWNNAGVALLSRNDCSQATLKMAMAALESGLSICQRTLLIMPDIAPSPQCENLPISIEALSTSTEQALQQRHFVYTNAFKIRAVETLPRLETASACIIFNLALAKHIQGLQDNSTSSLVQATKLYALVLHISIRNSNPSELNATALLLSAVALNNRGAILSSVGQMDAARECYGNLIPLLPFLDRHCSKDSALGAGLEAIADTAISIVYEVNMDQKAAPAA
ncbi:MAG: hypothetical protein SGILL_003610 [Bacillariaceae sp.]